MTEPRPTPAMSAGELETVDAHLARVLGAVHPLAPVEVPLAEAGGRVLAVDVRSRLDIPVFDNSAMDGYAVRHADVAAASAEHPVTLRVVADVPAGSADDPAIGPGEAAHIMTGAPLPSAADAVVPVEHTDGGQSVVTVTVAPRRRGARAARGRGRARRRPRARGGRAAHRRARLSARRRGASRGRGASGAARGRHLDRQRTRRPGASARTRADPRVELAAARRTRARGGRRRRARRERARRRGRCSTTNSRAASTRDSTSSCCRAA